jgi:hypothetical protein
MDPVRHCLTRSDTAAMDSGWSIEAISDFSNRPIGEGPH